MHRRTAVLIVAVVVFALAAIFTGYALRPGGYHRKVVDGIECMVDGHGRPVSCNWRNQ